MLTFLLTRDAGGPASVSGPARSSGASRFYRVELAYNLFGEYSVLREWGEAGGRGAGAGMITWFANLRDACIAAERWRKRAQRRGYRVMAG